ncbi:hypothetical protein [Cerasicoccus frondis]|uniref:hypothetical protein n=1 Tax=Cerasicoccus frondis TaxID=490090 RepID=UPI0028526248|nr:hypothetical protein [Cerasicoccus frondis]
METIEPHIRPNISRLEKWRDDIAAMRRQLWPYTRIAQWLLDQHGLQISDVAIRKFCNRRGIPKGNASNQPTPRTPAKRSLEPLRPRKPVKRIFDFDENKPLEIHR